MLSPIDRIIFSLTNKPSYSTAQLAVQCAPIVGYAQHECLFNNVGNPMDTE